jgi:hypothetical protein
MAGILCAHSPKFESKLVQYNDLAALPVPAILGRHHKPIPHVALVDTILREADVRGYDIARQQYALGRKGAALFGVLDFVGGDERGISFGFRSAQDQSLALRGVAGSRVFVCDNLALSGDTFVLSRKHTTGLDLIDAVRYGFDKFATQVADLGNQIALLESIGVTDSEAKLLIYEVFAAKLLPSRLFEDVNANYFAPKPEWTDVQPRTKWGVHNAITRAIHDLSPTRAFGATSALGRQFGLTARGSDANLPVIDVEALEVAADFAGE